MNNTEYLTIAEFAERAKISRQAVYSRLNKGLKDFVKIESGKKFVSIKALSLYSDNEVEQEIKQDFQENQSTLNNLESTKIIETLNKTIELLQEQLKIKDEQITELHNLLDQQQKLSAQTNNLMRLGEEKEQKKSGFLKLFSRRKADSENEEKTVN